MIELIGRFIHVVSVAVLREIIHEGNVNAAAVALGNVRRPRLKLLPFIKGEQVAVIEDIFHIDSGLLRCLRFGDLAGVIRRTVCKDIVRRRLHHGVHRL